ncbi:hypothetical protein SCHPADRAFT_947901 [Schizopora paradoxa]|uniref:Uncharacterized protein n=1 Tax=Schizopora paradoxa TaxID=27342 RepID=A0A0H2QXT9_9AGAM|nr:hypothetical protein SCHPADRAFT_947901 [Schizopora paradoxa]
MARSSTKSSTRHHTKNSLCRDSLRQKEGQLKVDLSDPKLKHKPKGHPFRSESARVKGYNIQKEMGLADDYKLYCELLGAVRKSAMAFFKDPDQGIRAQGQLSVSAFMVKMVTKHSFFGKFQNAWPVTNMLGMVLANQAAGRKKADDGDLNAHLAAIDPLEGDVENEDFLDVPRNEDEEGSKVSEQQQDTPPRRRAAMKTKETKTPRIQSDKQTKKRLAKRRNQVPSDDESEEEPQLLKHSKHSNQDAIQSDQESNFGDENDNQPDTPAKSDAHEPSPEPTAVDSPADVPRADPSVADLTHPKEKRKQTAVQNSASVKDFPSPKIASSSRTKAVEKPVASSSRSEVKKSKAKSTSKSSQPTVYRTTRLNSRRIDNNNAKDTDM